MKENISESMRAAAAAVLVLFSGLAGIWWGIRMGRALQTASGGGFRAGLCAFLCVLMIGGLLFQGYSNLKTNRRYSTLYRILLWVSGILISLLIYGLSFMIPMDIAVFVARTAAGAGPGIRRALSGYDHAALFALALSGLETAYGIAHAQRIFVTRYDVPLKKMSSAGPDRDSGLRIAHLSDLHMGSMVGDAYIRRLLRKTAELHPDYVVITGDLFNHGFAEELRHPEKTEAEFRRLQDSLNRDHPASEPVSRIYAVLGNHDPLPDDGALLRFLKASGIVLLDDRAENLPEILLAGRNGNHVSGRRSLSDWLTETIRQVPSVSSGVTAESSSDPEDDKPLVVLDHYPDGIHDAQQAGADLMLCGHTHKGQYFPCDWLIRRRYAHGLLYGLSVWGHTVCIVSSGSGFFQIPIRIGTRSEIVFADLIPEREAGPGHGGAVSSRR